MEILLIVIYSNKCGTKIKNCSEISKVDQFLIIWFLMNPKILILPKYVGGIKKSHVLLIILKKIWQFFHI
jgi:hypothetical protein